MRNHEFVEKQPVILFLLGFCKFLRWYVLGKKNVYPKLFNSQSISNVQYSEYKFPRVGFIVSFCATYTGSGFDHDDRITL